MAAVSRGWPPGRVPLVEVRRERDVTGKQRVGQLVERVVVQPVLDEDADRRDAAQAEHQADVGGDLGDPHHRRHDHEEEHGGQQQRELLEHERELAEVHEVMRVEHGARNHDEDQDGGRDVDPGEPHPRPCGPLDHEQRRDPREQQHAQHQPVELPVQRDRDRQRHGVERHQPDHRHEAGEQPWQRPPRVRPGVVFRSVAHHVRPTITRVRRAAGVGRSKPRARDRSAAGRPPRRGRARARSRSSP
jgi:hypothetical protein